MAAKTTSSKDGRKIGAPEAVKRMDRALKRELSTPPKPYQQAPEREGASRKTNGATADETLRRIDQAANRAQARAQPKDRKPGKGRHGKSAN